VLFYYFRGGNFLSATAGGGRTSRRRQRYWLERERDDARATGGAVLASRKRRARWINGGMRNHWRSRKAFRRYANDVMRHRLAAAEDISGHSGRSEGSISVIHALDVVDIRDVGDGSSHCECGDVHDAKVVATVVIPGKKWFVGSEREPGSQLHRADAKQRQRNQASDNATSAAYTREAET